MNFTKETACYHDELHVDMYLPQDAPQSLLVYFHGGGFHSGNYNSEKHTPFFEYMARHGHAVATGQYRLLMAGVDRENGDTDWVAKRMQQANIAAVNDMRRLVAWIYRNYPALAQIPLVLGGSSAGAVTALNTSLWPADKFLEDGVVALRKPPEAVMSLAGGCRQFVDLDIGRLRALLCFHGSADPTVAFYAAPSRWCPSCMLLGARYFCDELHDRGRSYESFVALGGQHHWSIRPLDEFKPEILDFFDAVVVKGERRQRNHRFIPKVRE